MKVCLTGGIACGKSLLSSFLREEGLTTCDADDVVHTLIPEDERRRLAAVVFKDPAARKALEARIHPVVRERMKAATATGAIAVIPLVFEVQWDGDYDIIACVVSSPSKQIERMMTTRGYSREEAEARLAAQMPVEEKARRSHYIIRNDGSAEDLRMEAHRFVDWLKRQT